MTHTLAHLTILLGYVAAMILVPTALGRLIHISFVTRFAGAGFFLFCGLTHLGLVLDQSDATWASVTDHIQAVAIWAFAFGLLRDLNAAIRRRNAILRRADLKCSPR